MKKCYIFVCVLLASFCTTKPCYAQDFNWIKRAGDNNNVSNYGTATAVDHNHNVVVTGTYASGCVYGLTALTGPGTHNIFLSRYDSSGNLKWVHTIGGNNIDEAAGVAVDNAGNIYIAGNMKSPSIYFDAFDSLLNTNSNGWNGFVAKYDSFGNFIWSQGINGPSDNKVESVTTDAAGNVIIGGYFTNSAFFQGTQLRGGVQNIFLTKYSSAGILQWATAGKSNNNCFAKALTTDAAGNIYTTGKISGDIAFSTSTLGIVYDQVFNTTFLPGNFYTSLPNATLNFTASGMKVSGGAGTFSDYLYYYYYSNLENFKIEANLKVTASGAGVGLGKYCGVYALANFPLSVSGGNQVYFYNGSGGTSLSATYNISLGDSINVSVQRNFDTMSATLINYSKHYTVSTGYRYIIGLPYSNAIMPNNGYYAMFFLGGSQTIYEYKVSSTENTNALCGITGNSITTGYNSGGYGHRYSDVLYNSSPYLYDVNAGAGDLTYHVLIDTFEMISLNPKYVLINIGVNDAGSGVDTNIYQTEYSEIVGSYKRHGIIPVADLLVPLGGTEVYPYNRRIKAVAAANGLTVVDITTALADPITGYLQTAYNSGDNVHPNAAGNIKMAQTIAAQAPFVLSDTTSWGITHKVITLPSGNDRVFTAKYNSAGVVQWVQLDTSTTATGTSPNNNYSCGNTIGLDNSGNVYVGGSLLDATVPVTVQDAFIEKYSNGGIPIWQKRWGGNAYDAVQGLATNARGIPYIIGNYGGSITISGTPLPVSDLSDIFFAKFDTSGNALWVTNASGHGNFGNSIAVDATDSTLAMTGTFNDSAKFGSLGITSSITPSFTNYDIFVAKHSGINPNPLPITGATVLCAGSTIALSDATPGGLWSSSNTVIATVGTASGIVTGLLAGTSIITYKLANGYFANATITVNPLPFTITGATGVCNGSSSTLSDATLAGTWTSTNITLAIIGSASGIVSALATGTDTIVYTLSTGCKTTFPLTVNPLPLAISGSASVCAGGTTTLSNATISGTWSSSNLPVATVGIGIVAGISAGTSTISYKLATGCLSTTVVTVNPLPVAITGSISLCTGAATTLTDGSPGGTWGSSNTGIATIGLATGIMSGTSAGTSTITYVLPTGCLTTASVTVNPLPSSISGTTGICTGTTTSLTDVTSFGSWSSSNSVVAPVGTGTGIVSGLAIGTSTITYNLATGCSTTTMVTVNPVPLTITGITTLCAGATVNLTDATPGGAWGSSNTLVATISSIGIVSGIANGVATITYTLPTGCLSVINVTVNPLPTGITGGTNVCAGSVSSLSDGTGFGVWSSSNTLITTISSGTGIFSGVAAGTATITYKLATGCSATALVNVNPVPSAISGVTGICTGTTSSLTDATPFGAWSSSNSAIAAIVSGTGIVSGIISGIANVTYALSTGCLATSAITVNPTPLPVTGAAGICMGSTTVWSNGTPFGSWNSSSTTVATIGAGTGIASPVSAGIAIITYKLATGCQSTAAVTVNPLPLAISGATNICIGTPSSLTDGTPFGIWSSSNSLVATIGSGTGIVSGLGAGAATITYELTTGCTATSVLTVSPSPLPVSGATGICSGSTTSLTDATGFGSWSSGNTVIATVGAGTGLVSAITPGIATITYKLGSGCLSVTSVTVNPLPLSISGSSNICTGNTASFADGTPFGDWSSSNTAVAAIGSGTGTVSALTAGVTTITYSLASGCFAATTLTINASPASITGVTSVCSGTTTLLSDITGFGSWSSGNTSVATIGAGTGIVSGIVTGSAAITYELSSGCLATTSVTVNPLPLSISGAAQICSGANTTLSDVSAFGAWSSSDTAVATIGAGSGIVSGINPGLATITYVLATGCKTTANFTVNPIPNVFAITGGGSYCAGGPGVHVGLGGSDTGISYQLYNGILPAGSPLTGTGTAIDFGLETIAGTYKVIATNTITTCVNNMASTVLISISPLLVPSVAIANNTGDTVCAGTVAAFTATGANTGSSPTFQWNVNGANRGTDTPWYSYIPKDGDAVAILLTSDAPCASPVSTMAIVTMTVDSPYLPSVTIAVDPGTTIAPHQNITFYATATEAGPEPQYQWLINGAAIPGANAPIFSSDTISNNDSVSCLVAGSGICSQHTISTVTVYVNDAGTAIITPKESSISVLPNPNTGAFIIKGTLGNGNDEEVSIVVTDMLGQVIYTANTVAYSGQLNTRVQLANTIANGMYLLNVVTASDDKLFHIVLEQ